MQAIRKKNGQKKRVNQKPPANGKKNGFSAGKNGKLAPRITLNKPLHWGYKSFPYNPNMPENMFEDMKHYLGFTPADAGYLKSLGPKIGPMLGDIADRFYDTLVAHPEAKAVFAGDIDRIRHLRGTLHNWLEELFSGQYNLEYFESRCNIGRVHVRVNLPQHYMFTAMNVLRLGLIGAINRVCPSDSWKAIQAIEKLLDMELAIMNQTYREQMVARIQLIEQNRLEERLSESEHLATVGGLAASLAHEIKNPLAGISGAIQVIGAGLDAEHPHREIIDEILRQIDRLDNAVRDLLIYARPKPPSKAETNIDDLLTRVLKVLKEEPAFRNVQIRREIPNRPVVMKIDETQVQQVLINLLLNAAHASRENGEIFCRVIPNSHGARIEIEDYGVGIPREILNRIWEPFFTTKAKGTGLGLSICKRIVEAHGGVIQVVSESGKGTLVAMDLPITSGSVKNGKRK